MRAWQVLALVTTLLVAGATPVAAAPGPPATVGPPVVYGSKTGPIELTST
jgi:hypothetical protein